MNNYQAMRAGLGLARQQRPPDHLIVARREQEAYRAQFETQVCQEKKLRLRADWEIVTEKKVKETTIRRKVDEKRQRHFHNLEARRQRLYQLLKAEEEALIAELKAREETPEQRKERLLNRARELRKKRQEENDEYVKQKLHQQWRERCDDLREHDSKQFLLYCHSQRKGQLEEKLRAKMLEEKENLLFDRMWEEMRQQKIVREEQDRDRERRLNDEAQAIITQQLEALQLKREEEAAREQREADVMKQQWEFERIQEEKKLNRERELAKQRNKLLQEYNIERLKIRAEELRKERELDLMLLNQMLENERLAKEIEDENKNFVRDQARKYREHLRLLMQKEREDEAALEKMRAEYQEREWQKRVEQWEKEEAARRALMNEVMETRRMQLEEKRRLLEQERVEGIAERERLINEVSRLAELDKLGELERLERNKQYQDQLRQQILEKEDEKMHQIWESLREKHAMEMAERTYQRKVQDEFRKTLTHYDTLKTKNVANASFGPKSRNPILGE